MKKTVTLIVCILMLLPLCACGAQSAKSAARDEYYVSEPAEAPAANTAVFGGREAIHAERRAS